MGTLTVFPSSEGHVLRYYSYDTFSGIRNGAGTDAYNPTGGSAINLIGITTGPSTNNYQILRRGFFAFDTSALTSAATVSSALFGVCPSGQYSGFPAAVNNNLYIGVYTNAQASNTAVVAADYDKLGTTLQTTATKSFSSLTSDTPFTLTLNATGRGNISKTGTTKFGMRDSYYDATNTAPAFTANAYFIANCYSNFGDPTYSPQLVITYTGDPTVTTQAASNVLPTSMTGNGNITSIGGATPTRRGFVYMVGTSGDPTTSNSVVYEDGSFGTGAYTLSITSLSELTSYRVRAYAVNSVGTSYGPTVQESTPASTAIKTIDGLARASIKTVNDLAIASMKTWDGLE